MKYVDSSLFRNRVEKNNLNLSEYFTQKEQMEKIETKISEALQVLQNRSDSEMVAEVVSFVLSKQHRTHQQSIVRTLFSVLKKYAETGSDLRNASAVEWAKKATDPSVVGETYFPYI